MDDILKENIYMDEIGNIAKIIDNDMTILERMKIKKSICLKIIAAGLIYLIMMSILSIIL